MSTKLPRAFSGGRQTIKNKCNTFQEIREHLRRCVLGKKNLGQGEGQPGDWRGAAVSRGVVRWASLRKQCWSADWKEVLEVMTPAAGGRGLSRGEPLSSSALGLVEGWQGGQRGGCRVRRGVGGEEAREVGQRVAQ